MTGVAFGKVILLGEHAVVYGVPAIAVAIDRSVRARAKAIDGGPSRLLVHSWNLSLLESQEEHDLARAFRALLDVARSRDRRLPAVSVEVEVGLPPGGGLGCSAAMGVAIARSIEPRIDEDALQDRAMAWERIFHGNPSGIDAAVAARGGCIYFKRGELLVPIDVLGPLHLCVGNTGIPSSTRAMVDAVADLRVRRPRLVNLSFAALGAVVDNARRAIEAGDLGALGKLMNLNQMTLRTLLVSSGEIDRMCALALDAGAMGAKLTGAGGGGSVVALVPSLAAAEAVLAAWRAAGFQGFATSVASETPVGVRSSTAASGRDEAAQ